jgi:ferritin-like metal-binding protein YciE
MAKKTISRKAAPKKRSAPKKLASARKTSPAQTKEESDSMLKEFLIDEIKDIYWAEKHLTKALPKMQKAATSEELQNAFASHLEQTEEHVTRLEKVFELLDEKAQAKKCDAMAGLVEEAQGVIEDTEKGTATRDVGLIIAAQKVEHYEIATYGSLATLAKTLGLSEVTEILLETLDEEEETDEKLTTIAKSRVNSEAATEKQEA